MGSAWLSFIKKKRVQEGFFARRGGLRMTPLGGAIVRQDLAETGTGSSAWLGEEAADEAGEDSGRASSQLQPSLRQAREAPSLPRFSMMKGAWHLGQGSAMGRCGVVKSHSG